MLFDAHTHMNSEAYTEDDRQELARKIEESDVKYIVDPGSDLESSLQGIRDAERYSWCFAAIGYHPHETDKMTNEAINKIRSLALRYKKVVAIGEIGLDFHYDISDREVQRYWFRRQIRMANEIGMPIMIHTREADQETMDILVEEGAFSEERKALFPKRPGPDGSLVSDSRVLLHCYSGSAELAKEYVKLGATISICGPVTFKNNRKTQRVVKEIPLEFLTIETDAPYLTPEPYRGRPNMAPYVEYIARKIAQIKGISYEEVAETTFDNAVRFYGIGED